MPDQFNINEKLGLIEIFSYGNVTAKDILGSIEKAQEVAKKLGIIKLLVDTTKQEKMPSTVSIFNIFSNFPRNLILAILTLEEQITRNDIVFGENVAVNRGVRMRVFTQREDAINWLEEF